MSKGTIDAFFTPRTKRQRHSSSPGSLDGDMASGAEQGEMPPRAQWLQELSMLLDKKLDKLATKVDLETFTARIEVLEIENKHLKEEVQVLKSKQVEMSAKLLDLEGRSRRNNLIFRGLKFDNNTKDFRALVLRFCVEKFGCTKDTWINRAHPLHDRKTVIAHFPVDSDIDYIMKRVNSLKGTGCVVHRDLPLEVRRKRSYLSEVRNEVGRVAPGMIQRTRMYRDCLVINGTHFTCVDGDLYADRHRNGGERLRTLIGHDVTDFLSSLKNKYTGAVSGSPPARSKDDARRHGGADAMDTTVATPQPTMVQEESG